MSAPYTRVSKRATRSQSFVVVLLVLMYMAQPALALLGLQCADHSCGAVSEHCCCEGPAEPAASEDGCCSDEQPKPALPDSPSADEECGCRADPTPLPQPDPAVPPRAGDATGDGSPAEWLRVHAEIFSQILTGPPGAHLPPGVRFGNAGRVPPPGTGDPSAGCVLSAGAWTLLMRGVSGFLALLSVARI